MTPIPGVGPQLDRAAAGTDPRGVLTFEYLPPDLQRAEDSTAFNDYDQRHVRGRERPATETERILLQHLGYNLPAELTTTVTFKSRGVRNRRWPVIENQEVVAP